MTTVIPFANEIDTRYQIILQLSTGKNITIDLEPLRLFIEKNIIEPSNHYFEMLNKIIAEILKENASLAEVILDIMNLLLKNAAIKE